MKPFFRRITLSGIIDALSGVFFGEASLLPRPAESRRSNLRRVAAMLVSIAYCMLCSVSCVYCVITAFDIPVLHFWLIIGCLFMSGVYVVLSSFNRPGVTIGIFALLEAFVYIALRKKLYYSMCATIKTVWSHFEVAFPGVKSFDRGGDAQDGVGATLFLLLLANLLIPIVCWAVARRTAVWPVVAAMIFAIVPCLIILDTQPAVWALLLFTGSLALLTLSQSTRKYSGYDGAALSAKLALPLALLMASAVLISPPARQEADDWPQKLREGLYEKVLHVFSSENSIFDYIFGTDSNLQLDYGMFSPPLRQMNLNDVGPQGKNGVEVMRVYCGETNDLYLKANSLAVYENNTWSALDASVYDVGHLPDVRNLDVDAQSNMISIENNMHDGTRLMALKPIEISTVTEHSVLYTPYLTAGLPEGASPVFDAYYENSSGLSDYIMYTASTPSNLRQMYDKNYESFVYERYMDVPENVGSTLRRLAGENGLLSISAPELPMAVARYIKNAAVYDLKTPEVLNGEDFVLWFLTQSKQGYCTHFASAAVLMLRELGIPARFVTGYHVFAIANKWVSVTDDDAHAWVEYYVKDVGWQMLEVTGSLRTDPLSSVTTSTEATSATVTTTSSSDVLPGVVSSSEPTPTGSNAATTTGSAPLSTDGEPEESEENGGGALWWLIIPVVPLVIAAAVLLGRKSAIEERKRAELSDDLNQSVGVMWRYACELCKAEKREPPESLEAIALKARFSQHSVTREEYAAVARFCRERAEALKNSDKLGNMLIHKYINRLY